MQICGKSTYFFKTIQNFNTSAVNFDYNATFFQFWKLGRLCLSLQAKSEIYNLSTTMNLKSLLFAAGIALMAVACGKTEKAAEEAAAPMGVDSVMACAAELVGDTIEVEGYCSHLCKHGGTKAFLVGADSTTVLRCQATAEMGGAFSPDCVGKELTVKGVVCESRIGEEEVAAMEARQAAADSAQVAHEACDTEKKAQGQAGLSTFEERMADYRAKIAARQEAEGKAYLSFYYIEALSYTKE